jgi:hypothetical protein
VEAQSGVHSGINIGPGRTNIIERVPAYSGEENYKAHAHKKSDTAVYKLQN